ncbi:MULTISPECIES: preprotein translocase subunit SecG [Alteromonadaceae]|jgi:preprotein translocase subunit SecG|uniref:Protein-export membrane protein SecG n=1 Tax=Brumicola blandensis TaxID=3075611 RepID=A0AAW8R0J9_9ALTE|nr:MULTISPECIES: preprotein translocase subunit SecG [unclassified Alteromonas]MDT0581767.1 preprotein translocase subunit SecG [Alteromonas sp. W409]MDT0629818.1 preprotein translocase subunit SecG [Alteromonas sp. W364]
MVYQILMASYLIVALLLIGFVLIQQGKGADMGASFGAGGSNTVFGSSGSGNFMTKTTAILATLFFGISLTLGTIASKDNTEVDEFELLQAPVSEVPVVSDVPSVTQALPASGDVPAVPAVTEGDKAEDEKVEDKPN